MFKVKSPKGVECSLFNMVKGSGTHSNNEKAGNFTVCEAVTEPPGNSNPYVFTLNVSSFSCPLLPPVY